MELVRDRAARTLMLSQRSYAESLLQKFRVADAKPRATPLPTNIKLLRSEDNLLDAAMATTYREAVGGLMYLACNTRPDLAQSVGMLARFMSAPTAEHWAAVISVLRYLRGTADLGLNYGGSHSGGARGSSTVEGYCDADWAGDLNTRRSTTGFVFLLNGAAISWSSRLQQTVSTSTVEAEYVAAAEATREALWLRKLMRDLDVSEGATVIRSDNQGALSLVGNPIISERSKHIDIVYHFVRERAARGEIQLVYCPTEQMVADVLTKPLPEGAFVGFRIAMGVY
jgi:hypothetical protein